MYKELIPTGKFETSIYMRERERDSLYQTEGFYQSIQQRKQNVPSHQVMPACLRSQSVTMP